MATFTAGDRAGNARKRSRIAYGRLSKTRKLLRRLPDDLVQPIREALKEGAAAILADAKAGAPRSGEAKAAADALRLTLGRDGLSAKVGILGKRAAKQGFYLKFHETGTKGNKEGFGKGIALPPIPARPFLGPAFDAHRSEINRKVQAGITRAVNRAAGLVNSEIGSTGGRLDLADALED